MIIARSAILALLFVATPLYADLPPASVTNMNDPVTRAATCAAFLYLNTRFQPSADQPRFTAAMEAWQADLERRRRRQGDAGRYFQAALATAGNASINTRLAATAYCQSYAPARARRR